MGRMAFVLRRLLMLVPVAVGVTIIVFFMIHLIPGDPARTILGIHATPRAVAILHRQWGLDRPLVSQYWLFMDRLLHGNRDHVVRAVPLLGLGMPPFWVGILLIYALAIHVRWFPVSGYGTGFGGHLHAMFLPALTVAIALAPVVIRALRASMLTVLGAEYITTARSKGVPRSRLFLRHVLRNAVIPAVTVLGINIGFLIGGTVVIENVFAIPGIGQLMINSIFQRDFPVVQGVTLVFGVLVVLVNLLADLSYAALDPRVRFDR